MALHHGVQHVDSSQKVRRKTVREDKDRRERKLYNITYDSFLNCFYRISKTLYKSNGRRACNVGHEQRSLEFPISCS